MQLGVEDLEELLDRLERLEDPLLAWGVVNSALSEGDVDRVIEDWLLETGQLADPLEVLDALVDSGLLIRADDAGGYRTRMAETLRLLVGLRQLFPKPDGQSPNWRGAPTLVGGIRFTRRPRRYPRRDVDPLPLMEELTEPGSVEREVFRRLVSRRDGTPWQLAGFQARATRTILQSAGAPRTSGAIIGAGTGSGKTLAFYLPAFTHLAKKMGPSHRLEVLALYPRNELLRDQLQAGLEQAISLQETTHRGAGRPMRVGALFGAVPQTVPALRGKYYRSWRRQGETYVCPYVVCPGQDGSGCGGQLVVDAADEGVDEPYLRCVNCTLAIDPDVFPVTREQMRRRPPDVLYCSTEMLNRSLLDPSTAHVLGLDVAEGPSLVLLDEVHTYGGTSGAMTALSLRRWRHRVASEPVFVGLSATLLDAPQFFSDLIGLHADTVADIAPDPEELVPEGAEYQIVARGDPTSGAGLLSTTIQAAMLIGRTMDAPDASSSGLFGQKVFAFTDDLDVTNRLYFDLLDAEGQRHRGSGAHLVYKPSLAHLRSPAMGDVASRRRAAQVWDLAEATGHGLEQSDRLRIGRTSSQDAGLDSAAQVIVATASLEVGVDDPQVGAILQHKAPRDNAAFLQRQGRAGRERGMRPLTLVVLSDYGRDRHAYEAWDQLLSPLLRPNPLPVKNVHVLRMQAALATLGWGVLQAGADVRAHNMWNVLARPPRTDRQRAAQHAVAERLQRLLNSSDVRAALAAHLQQSLGLESSDIEDLLWQPPRPVLLAAVPALLRRIEDQWGVVDSSGPVVVQGEDDARPLSEDEGARQPIPSFVPATLFSPLALPEVLVDMPAWSARNDGEVATESLGLVQFIRELAPGRVTKRFAVSSDLDRAWVPVDPTKSTVDVSTFVTVSQLDGELGGLPLLRPLRAQTQQPAEHLRDSTHGRPIWLTEIRAGGQGVELGAAPTHPIGQMIENAEAHLHRDQRQVEVRRGVVGSDVRIVMQDGTEHRTAVELQREGDPVAVGGAFDVDGIRFRLNVPTPDEAWKGSTGRGLRTAWFDHRVSQELEGIVDPFLVTWIHDVVLTTLLRTAIEYDLTLEESWSHVSSDLVTGLEKSMEILLATPGFEVQEADEAGDASRLVKRLREVLGEPEVRERLDEAVAALWEDIGRPAEAWLRRRLLRTVGEVLLGGAALLCPEHDPESVVLDVEPPGSEAGEVWITETAVGGGGFLEAVADAAGANPARFLRLARANLRPGTSDVVRSSLEQIVARVAHGGPLAEAFKRYRDAVGSSTRTDALAEVRDVLRAEGVSATPDVVGATATRLLRPGSTKGLDDLVAESLARWVATEERLGVEVPLRTWCFLDAMGESGLDATRLDQLQLILWPRGSRTRDRQLASYNPFTDEFDPAPAVLELALDALAVPEMVLSDTEETWKSIVAGLQDAGVARLRIPNSRRRESLRLLARAATEEVELDVLRVYAELTDLSANSEGDLTLELELPQLGAWGRGGTPAESDRQALVRRIMTTGGGPSSEVEQVLHLVFASELVRPSQPLWVVSAWLSDVTVVDNRGGELLSVAPGLPTRRLGLVEVITELVIRGGHVRVVVRDDPHNRSVVARLRDLQERTTAGEISIDVRPDLHDKLVVSEHLLLEGSMNLTHRGATRNEEGLRVVGEKDDIARQRVELARRFG